MDLRDIYQREGPEEMRAVLDEAFKELKTAERRYEYVRSLNVPQFKAIFERCLKGERFDEVIDACIAARKPHR